MLQNHQHQGLVLEDQGLGLMGLLSNPNSNNLPFLPHHNDHLHHHYFPSSHLKSLAASIMPSSIPSDDDDDDHDRHAASSNNSSTDLCQALFMSCADPKPRHHDPPSLMAPPNLSDPWECMLSKNGSSSKDLDHGGMNKKNVVGVNSAVRMKKMKGRRKVREPRFCFKTLSDVDVLDDGYKWRKYGQKVVKNTQHPRSYYRCTQDKCRVKKRVERLAEDPRMVITTYEGRHVHSPSHDNPDEDSNRAHPLLNNFFW